MTFKLGIPGMGDFLAGPFDTVGAAVAHRDELWKTKWGGQAIVLVDEATGAIVRPCLACRGSGNGTLEGRAFVPDEPCDHCKGSGRDPEPT